METPTAVVMSKKGALMSTLLALMQVHLSVRLPTLLPLKTGLLFQCEHASNCRCPSAPASADLLAHQAILQPIQSAMDPSFQP